MTPVFMKVAVVMVVCVPLAVPVFGQAPVPVPAPGAYTYPAPVPVAVSPVPLAPTSLTIPLGTFVTVEVTDRLSTDRSHPGDAFNAILRQPIVVDGWVVARAGQPVIGRVVSVQKAGRIQGKSEIALELDELVLVDGQQVPVRTQEIRQEGTSSTGRDLGAVVATTAIGALIGGGVSGGEGAAIGAGVGAGAGTAGVLATPRDPTRIHSESVLAFRLDDPIAISTVRSAQAFIPVTAADYRSTQAPRLRAADPVVYAAPAASVIVVPDRYPRRYRRY